MAKATKPKEPRKKRGEYEEPLKVDGTFMDIMKAAVKHRRANVSKKQEPNIKPNDSVSSSHVGG